MPLPTGNPEWPPASERAALDLYAEHHAWWSGEPEALSHVYGNGTATGTDPKSYDDTGSVLARTVRRVVRYFWGQTPSARQAPSRMHVPLASEICEGSAQILFEELPRITLPKGSETGQERLEKILQDGGVHATLLEAAEICAAYGGVYLRAGWDETLAGVALLDAIAPDCAVPDFSRGRLTAVTFWKVVDEDRSTVWRHLERHENGQVLHGLYQGTRDKLGREVPLTDQPATEGFADLVDENGAIPTGYDGLTAVYIPNVGPNRKLRGSPLGRSDLDGIEQLLDFLDETWSSWGREHRLAAARAIIPNYMLRDLGAGQGARFDDMQEFFTGVNIPPNTDAGVTTGQMIQLYQPNIRVEEHARTCSEIAVQAIRGAGYSAASQGESGEGQAGVTATEIHDRHRLTLQTRARKIGYWRPELSKILEALLAVDRAVFPGEGAVVARPDVEWPDGVAPDPEALSRTLVGFAQAEAASIRTRVQMAHPDWDEKDVDEEVERIRSDRTSDADPWMDAGEGLAGNRLRGQGDEPAGAPPEGEPSDE